MIYGSTAWSETPISTVKVQELNGEEYLYELIIDGVLSIDLEIQQEIDFSVQ